MGKSRPSCRRNSLVREIAYLLLAEDIPTAFNSCRKGPRGVDWRADKDAGYTWHHEMSLEHNLGLVLVQTGRALEGGCVLTACRGHPNRLQQLPQGPSGHRLAC